MSHAQRHRPGQSRKTGYLASRREAGRLDVMAEGGDSSTRSSPDPLANRPRVFRNRHHRGQRASIVGSSRGEPDERRTGRHRGRR